MGVASVQMSVVDDVMDKLKSMTLLEAAELVKAIEETFDVDASAGGGGGMMMMAPGAAAADAPAAAEVGSEGGQGGCRGDTQGVERGCFQSGLRGGLQEAGGARCKGYVEVKGWMKMMREAAICHAQSVRPGSNDL